MEDQKETVQRCKSERCSCAKARDSAQGETGNRGAELRGGSIGEPDEWVGTYIFGSQVSAVGYQVREFGFGDGS